jgi:hypothetical protein
VDRRGRGLFLGILGATVALLQLLRDGKSDPTAEKNCRVEKYGKWVKKVV